ncbi:MAG: hypothetical protein U0X74_08665 [Anaerolineales bacterium]
MPVKAKSKKNTSNGTRAINLNLILLLVSGLILLVILSTTLLRKSSYDIQQTVSIKPNSIKGTVIMLRSFDPPTMSLSAGIKVFDVWGLVGLEPNWNIDGIVAKYRESANPAIIPMKGNPALYPFDIYEATIRIVGKDDYFVAFYQDGMRDFEYHASITNEPFDCCDVSINPDWKQAAVSSRWAPPSFELPATPDSSPKVKIRIERPISVRITALAIIIILGMAIWLPILITDDNSFIGVATSILIGIWGIRPILIPQSVTYPILLEQVLITYYFWLFGLIFLRLLKKSDKRT